MSKDRKQPIPPPTGNEIKIKEVVELLVDVAEEKKIHPQVLLAAMEHMAKKIKNYFELELLQSAEAGDTLH